MKKFSIFNIKTVFLNLQHKTNFFSSNKTMYYKTGILIDFQCQLSQDVERAMLNVILFYLLIDSGGLINLKNLHYYPC